MKILELGIRIITPIFVVKKRNKMMGMGSHALMKNTKMMMKMVGLTPMRLTVPLILWMILLPPSTLTPTQNVTTWILMTMEMV